MLLRAIKIIILLAFFARLALSRYWDATLGNEELELDVNDSMEFPNLVLQQKEREGVSGRIAKLLC